MLRPRSLVTVGHPWSSLQGAVSKSTNTVQYDGFIISFINTLLDRSLDLTQQLSLSNCQRLTKQLTGSAR